MKTTLFMVISLNGIIARENGKEDFLSDVGWYDFKKLSEKAGCFVMGRRTYDACKKYYSKYGLTDINCDRILVSRKMKAPKGFIVAKSPRGAIKLASDLGRKSLILSGGSKTNSAFMKEGLIDEIILNVEPVALGRGITLFHESVFERQLKLLKVEPRQKSIVQLHYKVEKNGRK